MIAMLMLWIGPKHNQRTKVKFPDFYTCLRVCFPLNPNHGTFRPSKEKKNHINLGPLSIAFKCFKEHAIWELGHFITGSLNTGYLITDI